jgi:hypothetical protein
MQQWSSLKVQQANIGRDTSLRWMQQGLNLAMQKRGRASSTTVCNSAVGASAALLEVGEEAWGSAGLCQAMFSVGVNM